MEVSNNIVSLLNRALKSDITVFLDGEKLKFKLAKAKKADPEIVGLLKIHKEEIINFLSGELSSLKGMNDVTQNVTAFDRSEVDRIPLSYAQQRLWFVDQLGGSLAYHMPLVQKFDQHLNREALDFALREIANRHEVLRTIFLDDEGKAYQKILPKDQCKLNDEDQLVTEHQDTTAMLQALIKLKVNQPFDLSKDYPFRADLIKVSEKEFYLVLVIHHIAFDGWSNSIFVGELMELYRSKLEGRTPDLPLLPIQYADYALWQRTNLDGEKLEQKLDYWDQKLAGLEVLDLPTDFARPAIQSTKGAHHDLSLNKQVCDQLFDLAQAEGVTMFMLFMTVFKILLHKYTGKEDIAIGTPIANRMQPEIENLIGFFVNTLTIRTDLSKNPSFRDLLQNVKATVLEAYDHQEVPFEQIVDRVTEERNMSYSPLFQVLFSFEVSNYPSKPLGTNSAQKDATDAKKEEETLYESSMFDLSFILSEGEKNYDLKIEYCSDLFLPSSILQIANHFEYLLSLVSLNADLKLEELNLLSSAEKEVLLKEFNDTSVPFPKTATAVSLFEASVAKYGTRTAIALGAESLSYKELDQRTNQLARYLKKQGVRKETLMALCMNRSLDMMVGILGILKAGGAYVPIAADYPQDRIDYILADSQAKFVLTDSTTDNLFATNDKLITISLTKDRAKILKASKKKLSIDLQSNNLMYVIYTSGSTGKPKGVMVEHSSNVNMALDQIRSFEVTAEDKVLQFASIAFDASVYETFMAFYAGATLVLVDQETIKESVNFVDYLKTQSVSVVTLPPVYLSVLDTASLSFLRVIITAGEAANVAQATQCAVASNYYNAYGPTECAVCVSFYKVTPEDQDNVQIPIGKPLSNTKLYILDEQLKVVPISVEGEICVSGEGLARGYLNRADLTAEKFVAHPYEAGGKLYRTGDRGKFLADGNIVFLGRKDDQVKIRGHRIELGEIETVLNQMPNINQGVVVTKKDKSGNNRLLAYFVGETAVTEKEIQSYLGARLPAYMVPTITIGLAAFPQTTNGKIDKKALPNPEVAATPDYLAPRTKLETDIAAIWKTLLNVSQVSVHDNFFKLGGDSIISIQVVSRIKRLGYQLQPRDLFHHQTVSELARFIKDDLGKVTILAEQGVLMGTAPLLPVQQWFFEKDYQSLSHFNMVNLFEVDKGITRTALDQIFKALVQQHDALRFKYTRSATEDTLIQEFGNAAAAVEFVDLSKTGANKLETKLTEICQKYQESLNLEKGILIKAVFIATPGKQTKNRFFIVVHHLVIDAVSWHILLTQMQEGMEALEKGEAIDFGLKSTSVRQWGENLQEYTTTAQVESQLPHWKNVAKAYQALPVDHPENQGKSFLKDADLCTVSLSKTLTEVLLKEANTAYGTEINDILLSALVKSINDWSAQDQLVIGLEGHGREFISSAIDLSNTVGWFTNLYPVSLAITPTMSKGDLIKSTKEQLRAIPAKGLGYNLLRYLHPKTEMRDSLASAKWDIVFNYLGQEDNSVEEENWLMGAPESPGVFVAEDYPLSHKFEINGSIVGGQLSFNWMYSTQYYERATVEGIAESFIENLMALIVHCQEQETTEKTPHDYGLAPEVEYQELHAFLVAEENGIPRKDLIEGVYRLAPMQEGMLFHHLYDEKFGSYTEQLAVDFLSGLDIDIFETAWEFVIGNHSILRTRFFSKDLSIPVQAAYRSLSLPFEIHDFTNYSPTEQVAAWEAFSADDLARGFDFNEGSLMRISLLKMDDQAYKMLWTFHHILIDGWSNPILIEELMTAYELLSKGTDLATLKESLLVKEDRFEDFIKHIATKDKIVEQGFWKKYLGGFESASLLPFIEDNLARNKGGITEELEYIFTDETTEAIKAYCQANFITVNTLIQGVWGFLLSKYTGHEDIIFGATVSGRPADLADAESRIGLFINTMPVRVKLKEDQTISTILRVLQGEYTAAREYQYTALNDIQRWINFSGEFFDSLIAFQNYPVGDAVGQAASLEVGAVEIKEQTNYLLSIAVYLSDVLDFKFRYNSNLLTASFARMVKDHFVLAVEQTIQQQITKFSEVELVTPKERGLLLNTFNDTTVPYAKDKSIIAFFEDQVAQIPTQTALIFKGETLSYEGLNQRANQLAACLLEKGVRPQDKVGILVYRGFDMIVSLLATLKCGAIYVPLNIDYPKARLAFILDDAEAKYLIYDDENILTKTGLENYEFIAVSDSNTYSTKAVKIPDSLSLTSGVYVMYTSGTTGQPKGILVNQENILKLSFETGPIAIYAEDRVLQWSNFSFDGCTYEIYGTLLNGASLCMITEKEAQDPVSLARVIRQEKLTVNFMTTALFNAFVDQDLAALNELRMVLFGGELVSVPHVKRALATLGTGKIIHVYGPTETTTYASYYPVEHCNEDRVPIGKPLSNTQIYILDAAGELTGVGMTGEIYIGGAGVSTGYLNRAALMSEKFVEDKFSKKPGAKLYRTGDLGFWLPDGNVEFIGRKDLQVKVRGYRIELGAIETKLQASDAVNNCVVLAKTDSFGTKCLIAYVIPNGTFQKEEILNYLKAELPEYMVPSIMIPLLEFPLNANGKVDKRALPEPDLGTLLSGVYVAPQNEMEKQLVAIWKTLLQLDKVGIYDNFFDLGGHSLLAIGLQGKVQKVFSVNITLQDVFTYPDIVSLAKYIDTLNKDLFLSIEKVEDSSSYPVSSAQKRLYYLYQLDRDSTNYNITITCKSKANLEISKFEKAIFSLVDYHESLRTNFDVIDGEIRQVIKAGDDFKIDYYTTKNNSIDSIVESFIRPFNLEKDYLFRVGLVNLENDTSILIFDLHHIITDGVSSDILLRDFRKLYHGKKLLGLNLTYKDYSAWQQKILKNEDTLKDKTYFLEMYAEEITPLELPSDFNRPLEVDHAGSVFSFELGEAERKGLQALMGSNGTRMYVVLLSLFKILFSKLSGSQEDIVVGTVTSGRNHDDLEDLVGMFVNTLALRSYPTADKTFHDYLLEVRSLVFDSFSHQLYQFDDLINDLSLAHEANRNPLFDVMFSYFRVVNKEESSSALMAPYEDLLQAETSKFDLMITASEYDDELSFDINYKTCLFKEETISTFVSYFRNIIQTVILNKEIALGEINLLDTPARTELVNKFNLNKPGVAPNITISALFKEQVRKDPEAVAVVFENKSLTYRELDYYSDKLSYHLLAKGLQLEQPVPIHIDRSLEMIIGIIGILKAGACYVPIDAEYPKGRIEFILKDTKAKLVVTSTTLSKYLDVEIDTEFILLDDKAYLNASEPQIELSISPNNLAYIIYTSGSTGQPKGVAVAHRNLISLLASTKPMFDFSASDIWSMIHSFSFDFSVWEIFGPLLSGGKLVIIPSSYKFNPTRMVDVLEKEQVTVLNMTPSAYKMLRGFILDKVEWIAIRYVIFGGEELKPNIIKDWRDQVETCKFINMYGITETTVHTTYKEIGDREVENNVSNIGKPLSTFNYIILDANQNPVPKGVKGELYLKGEQVTRGYLNLLGVKNKGFSENPFKIDESVYKTGDLVRLLENGDLEYLGRKDSQVEIRGHRIQLEEIVFAMERLPNIDQCVVFLNKDKTGSKYLTACFVSQKTQDKKAIRDLLKVSLPTYMMPAAFVQVKGIPVNINTKVDLNALKKIVGLSKVKKEYVSPRTELEKSMVLLWQKVLGLNQVGIDDNFFEIGGDSIKSILISKVGDISIDLKQIHDNPTIRALSEALAEDEKEEKDEILFEYSFHGKERKNIILIPYAGAVNTSYYSLAKKLGEHMNVYILNYPWSNLSKNKDLDGLTLIKDKFLAEANEKIKGDVMFYGHCAGSTVAIYLASKIKSDIKVSKFFIGASLLGFEEKYEDPELMHADVSDKEVIELFNDWGLDLSGMKDIGKLVRSFKHDVGISMLAANELIDMKTAAKLDASLITIFGENDSLTEGYKKEYKKWSRFFTDVSLHTIAEGGHYFVNKQPEKLAKIILDSI
ncbi:MAG: amino acid adenylation domain-containing protein [Saprospiraceae bacterium]